MLLPRVALAIATQLALAETPALVDNLDSEFVAGRIVAQCAARAVRIHGPKYFSEMEQMRVSMEQGDAVALETKNDDCDGSIDDGIARMLSLHKASMEISLRSFILEAPNALTVKQSNAIRAATKLCAEDTYARHKKALLASKSVYKLEAPSGYRIEKIISDSSTGFKAAIFEPIDRTKDKATIFAIAGTENLTDAYADLALGMRQFLPNRDEIIREAIRRMKMGREVVFTGHSLGGGLAQAFSYATAEALRSRDMISDSYRLHCVTWNAFGAAQLVEKSGLPRVAHGKELHYDSVNYRSPRDLVSLIGNHIGEVVNLPDDTMTTRRIIGQHGIAVTEKSAQNGGVERALGNSRSVVQVATHYWLSGWAELSVRFHRLTN
jgi:hypothetical protein